MLTLLPARADAIVCSAPTGATCAECDRLCDDSARLLLKYIGALDALAVTRANDHSYAGLRVDLEQVSERLDEAQRLEWVHQDSHRTS
jgi:hypothetical protein